MFIKKSSLNKQNHDFYQLLFYVIKISNAFLFRRCKIAIVWLEHNFKICAGTFPFTMNVRSEYVLSRGVLKSRL